MSIPSRQIGWSNESNLLWEINKQLQKLIGVTNNAIPTYKVYTALLTQGGASFLYQLDATTHAQNVTKGVTYTISNASDGDFLNVGAPNNDLGTSFVAINNNIPNSWGVSGAALLFDTGAPVVTVLENTIGNVWWTYGAVGLYYANSGLFTFNKTYVDCKSIFGGQWQINVFEDYEESSFPDSVAIRNWNISGGDTTDGIDLARIEIRVYP